MPECNGLEPARGEGRERRIERVAPRVRIETSREIVEKCGVFRLTTYGG